MKAGDGGKGPLKPVPGAELEMALRPGPRRSGLLHLVRQVEEHQGRRVDAEGAARAASWVARRRGFRRCRKASW